MVRKILIDGDYIAYTVATACQKTAYLGFSLDESVTAFAPNLTALAQQLYGPDAKPSALKGNKVFSRVIIDDNISYVMHSAKKMLKAIISRMHKQFGDIEVKIYVQGPGNFRDMLPQIKPYKGNRPSEKPYWLPYIKQYLIEHHGAVEVVGMETDDRLAIEMSSDPQAVCVAVDKDMLQVPGIHYNPQKGGFKRVSELEGLQRLYVQAAAGDTADNIGGVYKVGQVNARKIFRALKDEKAMWQTLVGLYQFSIDKYGSDIYKGLTAYGAACANMRLVYLLRKPSTILHTSCLWKPPSDEAAV